MKNRTKFKTMKHFFVYLTVVFYSLFLFAKKEDKDFPLNTGLIKEIKNQGNSLISDRVGDYILRAESLADSKKYNKAIELLEYHYQRESWTKAEKAHFALPLAHLYKRIKNNKKALLYLQKALDSKSLSYSQHLSTLYYISQIYVEKEDYNQGLKLLKLWFSINKNPPPSSYILLAHCYYSKNQIQKALKYVEKTLSLVPKPLESWLQFAVAIYLKQKDYKKARPYLEKLIALYPAQPTHWKQLAGVYLLLDKTNYAFVTLDMANKMGHLKNKNEYVNLSFLYVDQAMPYQGAKFLKEKLLQNLVPKEKKNLEFLAEAFWLARNRKEALTYLKEASRKASQPVFFVKYGQRLLEEEQWKTAEQAFKKALNTEKIQKTIKEISAYKRKLVLANRKKSDFKLYQARAKLLPPEKQNLSPLQNSTARHSDHTNTPGRNQTDSQYSIDQKSVEAQNIESLKAPPKNYLENIYLGLGIAFYQQEKYERALSYFKKSIEVDDTFLSGYQWIDYTETILSEKQKEKQQS